MIRTSRRSFISGLSALIAAPAIVRVANIMPVRSMSNPVLDWHTAKVVNFAKAYGRGHDEYEWMFFEHHAMEVHTHRWQTMLPDGSLQQLVTENLTEYR